MNVNFTKTQKQYIINQVDSGEYQNYSEVVREALRLHIIYRKRMIDDLKKEIELGWNAPDSKFTMEEIIKQKG